MVLCVDEKTSLQPRPRKAATLPAQPGLPVRLEHEYERKVHSTCLRLLTLAQALSGVRPLSASDKRSLLPSWSTLSEKFPSLSR
jgi:hypothetical protein